MLPPPTHSCKLSLPGGNIPTVHSGFKSHLSNQAADESALVSKSPGIDLLSVGPFPSPLVVTGEWDMLIHLGQSEPPWSWERRVHVCVHVCVKVVPLEREDA